MLGLPIVHITTFIKENLDSDWRKNCKNIEGLKVPLYIWDKMKKHQKAGLKWLWNQVLGNSGGILGNYSMLKKSNFSNAKKTIRRRFYL